MTLTPTREQQDIIDAAKTTEQSLLINALAGAAKTSTLVMIAQALPSSTPILSLAFNKKIAVEMEKRLPSNVKSQTLNSLGHGIWATATGKRLVLNTKKNFELLKAAIDDLPRNARPDRDEFSATLKAIGTAKTQGYVPEGKYPHAARLISQSDFFDSLEDEVAPGLVEACLHKSIQLAYAGTIDFDDQIYMPALFGGTFPRFPLVLVDEAQDLSPLNHQMLRRLVTKRLIAVGDPWQSIYAFRGADSAGMSTLKREFKMREMNLSISFRCPRAVVELARERAPKMQWAPQAVMGSVVYKDQWNVQEIENVVGQPSIQSPRQEIDSASGAETTAGSIAIICRNNAPLFKLALELLKAGRGCQLVGSDLGPGLLRLLRKLGPESMAVDQVLAAITQWESARLSKGKSKAATRDRADCLRVFASFGGTLGAAIAYAEHIFKASGPIQLLSGHKAKGLEWDTVIHLDSWRIPSPYAETEEEIEQEKNLSYVITTRAKKTLIFADLSKFQGAQTNGS